MNEPSAARNVPIASSPDEAVTLPADVAATLGRDATMTVGAGRAVTLRPVESADHKLTHAESLALAGGSRPVMDATTLMHATEPLTDGERAALRAFLSAG